MDIQTFINNYYEAFSLKAELPIAFWYSDSLLGELKQTQGKPHSLASIKTKPNDSNNDVKAKIEEEI